MCSLTRDLILSKSKGKPIESLKKLNCWASKLTDISLLKELTQLEVLTLSVNQITTLKDVKYCSQLKELYIRDNRIANLDEIFYLKDLKHLKILWLADNECSKDSLYDSTYRLTVIRNLPNLQKLDNSNVTTEEIENALKYGRLIEKAPGVDSCNNDNQENTKNSEFDVYKNISPLDDSKKQPEQDKHSPSTKTSFDRKLEEITNFISEEFAENSDGENDVSKHSNRTVDIDVRSMQSQHLSSSGDLRSDFNEVNQNSNTLSAILLLVNDLNEFQLETVVEACEARKLCLEQKNNILEE